MKISIGESFMLESQLQKIISELRENNVKNLSLNVSIKRNLQKISELCLEYRKEINEFIPDRLKELTGVELISQEDIEEKTKLEAETNMLVSEFLKNTFDFEIFNLGVDLRLLSQFEFTFDSSNVMDFLFGENI